MSIDDLRVSIKELKAETKQMMELCEIAIEKSVDSIVNKDLALAREVIKMDDEIDNLRNKIIEKSIELTALKQPMAKDLRNIYALSTIVTDLERVGDYSVNIAMETIKIDSEDHITGMVGIPKMKSVCLNMLKDAKNALDSNETKLAYDAALEDNIVDDLYNDVYVNLLSAMHKDPNNINQGVKLIFVARYLERIGDHITNVCENIVYAIKGDMTELG
ncbi:phosphate signaling complex protein PhoU [Clostridium sp. LIBA-8841]|uniref:phosphate signaling complex protein PhoU n=1 Tax=Clostridium sp. LIBA-8841 TaxID=2987530 RepID=UPI002AC5AB38|nr:phosphate signaling complex protein PhoU [Clostridium sp. LIBA-8841]MDZ5254217.1 phosphate signaling complex protein PhoU [Clostridium sp. LIBA-8841]